MCPFYSCYSPQKDQITAVSAMNVALCSSPPDLDAIALCLVENGAVELIMDTLRENQSGHLYMREILGLAACFGPMSHSSAGRNRLVTEGILQQICQVIRTFLCLHAS